MPLEGGLATSRIGPLITGISEVPSLQSVMH